MIYRERFWEEDYWTRFGERVWYLFKVSTSLIGILGNDESTPYVELTAKLAKYIVEKLSEYVEVEEPVGSSVIGAELVTEYMRSLADFAIGKDYTVTLAWVFRNITFEYARASFDQISEDPRRFDYLADILGLRVIYEPPELLTGGEIDLSLYHAPGHMDHVELSLRAKSLGKGRFKYVVTLTDKFVPEESSIGALIVRLGLLAWEMLRRKPGIMAIYDTIDARTTYLELATSRIPPKATEVIESHGIGVLGDGRIFIFKREYVDTDGNIIVVVESETYTMGTPVHKACKETVYSWKGPLIHIHKFCTQTDLLLQETKYEIEDTDRKINVVEFVRGIQPYIFLGLWDLILYDDKTMLYTRI